MTQFNNELYAGFLPEAGDAHFEGKRGFYPAMTADRARGALAVLQDADGKFICEVPCGYIVEQTASAHKPRRIQEQRRRRAMLRRRVARSETPCLFANIRSTTRRRKSRTRS